MGKRSIVFPGPEHLVNLAKKTGLRLDRVWGIIEATLAQRPRILSISIPGPKQTVTIKLKRDPRKLRKQVFADAELGYDGPEMSETYDPVERGEDAEKGQEPSIDSIIDKTNISDMSPARIRSHNRTPQPLSTTRTAKPRYPIPGRQPNRFMTEEMRHGQDLFREKWAEANRYHSWPSWLLWNYDNYFVREILQWIYPEVLVSARQKFQAAVTLEAIDVYFRGHKPSKDSPLFQMSAKTIAKRVERFLKKAERYFEIEARYYECEAAYNSAEARDYARMSIDQASGDGDDLADNEEDGQDDVVRLWRRRLDDDE